jgi:hypothetical protein
LALGTIRANFPWYKNVFRAPSIGCKGVEGQDWQYPPALPWNSAVTRTLPADLKQAEEQARESLLEALSDGKSRRWMVSMRFEGLRVLPVALRLARKLQETGQNPVLAFPDAGSAALAQRDEPELAKSCCSLQDLCRGRLMERQDDLLLAVAPQPSDYDELEQACADWTGQVAMLNGRLEDAAVGIGSVARSRRQGFVATWEVAYWLQPLDGAALLHQWPQPWSLFRADPDGYRFVMDYERRPDPEQIDEALAGTGSELNRQMGAMDRFLNDLRS